MNSSSSINRLLDDIEDYLAEVKAASLPRFAKIRDSYYHIKRRGWQGVFDVVRWWKNDIEMAAHAPKWFTQRGLSGWSERDAWSIYNHIARIVTEVCDLYIRAEVGHPCLAEFDADELPCMSGASCGCRERYLDDLRKIRDGMWLLVHEDELGPDDEDLHRDANGEYFKDADGRIMLNPKVTEALDLFREHFLSLWM